MAGIEPIWAELISRLGLSPVGPTEDGLRWAVSSPAATVEVHLRALRTPSSVRVVVRPYRADGEFLLGSPNLGPSSGRFRTGEASFDEVVSIFSGGRTVLPRLGPPERERVRELVAKGAILSSEDSTFEPAITERWPASGGGAAEAAHLVRELARIAARLATDPPVEDLLQRWLADDAPMVAAAVGRRVVEILPTVTELQADTVCRLLTDKGADSALPLLAIMPPYPCVLTAWFLVGDPLDPRVSTRVVDAWAAGSPRPAARYLAWLLHRAEAQATSAAERLSNTPGLVQDPQFVREFLRAVRKDPPPKALPLLLQMRPRSSSLTRRMARTLALYQGPDVDRQLLEWLSSGSSGVRAAAAVALADRSLLELAGEGSFERLEPVRRAAQTSTELVQALLERLPTSHTDWLSTIRPHGEPDAIALIRRLGSGGADVDEVLLFWLDRGTLSVRLEAARALGQAGTARSIGPLRERAGSWFSDGGVREACRAALDQLRDRLGGAGALALAAGGELTLPDRPNQAD